MEVPLKDGLVPLRVLPGADLRKAIEECLVSRGRAAGFVLSGIGSLVAGKIRYAGRHDEAPIDGPLEVLSLAGSISPDSAHLHMSVSTASGQVLGGHVCYGNIVRTTAEVLVVLLPDWRLSREYDPATGYRELVVRGRVPPGALATVELSQEHGETTCGNEPTIARSSNNENVGDTE